MEPTVRAREWVKDPLPVPARSFHTSGILKHDGGKVTCFRYSRARSDVEEGGDEGDIGMIEDLGTMRKRERPVRSLICLHPVYTLERQRTTALAWDARRSRSPFCSSP